MGREARERDGSILVIEDDPVLNATLVEVLREEGYRAQGVLGVEPAHDELVSKMPALVMLDGWLGGEVPRAFLLQLAAKSRCPRVIVVSGSKGGDEIADEFALPLVRKPFDLKDLLDAVARGGVRPRRSNTEGGGDDRSELEGAVRMARARRGGQRDR